MTSECESFSSDYWHYLKRIHTNEKDHLLINLKKDTFLVGRGNFCDYVIIHDSISRSHALFERVEEKWIIHNLSMNGVYINCKKIPQNECYPVEVGQVIQFGCSLDKFIYRLGIKKISGKKKCLEPVVGRLSLEQRSCGGLKQHAESKRFREGIREEILQEKERIIYSMKEEYDSLQRRFCEERKTLKRKLDKGRLAQQTIIEEKESLAKMLKSQEELAIKSLGDRETLENQLLSQRLELERRLEEERTELLKKSSTLEEQYLRLEQEVKEREKSYLQNKKEQENLVMQNEKETEALKEEKGILLRKLSKVEMTLDENNSLLMRLTEELLQKQEMDEKLEDLQYEKGILKHDLHQAMEQGALVTELRKAVNLLEAQKTSLKQEVACSTQVVEVVRQQVVELVLDVLENELQCSICSELFVNATLLNCSHMFCKFCIDAWKMNRLECPNCRTPIHTETKSIAVDNFIEKIVETLSVDMKKQRNELIAQRSAPTSPKTNMIIIGIGTSNQPPVVAQSTMGRAIGGGGNQQGAGQQGLLTGSLENDQANVFVQRPPILVTSLSSEFPFQVTINPQIRTNENLHPREFAF